jgi:PHD/YefM family antitoxin component YafN of YafNO toxin-antitoxin module
VNGKAAAVVQDAESYQKLIDRLELLESVTKIRQSINEFKQGEGMPLNQAFAEFKEKYGIPD